MTIAKQVKCFFFFAVEVFGPCIEMESNLMSVCMKMGFNVS